MATESVSNRVRELARYLDGDLTREEAVDELDAAVVREVDIAWEAIDEDVEWGLHA